MGAPGDIVLESPPVADDDGGGKRRGKWPYAHQLAFYEKPLGASNRTLKGWMRDGRDANPPELPPFDEPWCMGDWYARHKKNRVPDHLVALAATKPVSSGHVATASAPECGHVSTSKELADAGPLFSPPVVAPSVKPSPTPAAAPRTATSGGARGYTATLERLREAEAAAGARYTELVLLPDKQSETEQARRAWESLTKQLRAYEKDAEDIMQKSGQSWISADVIAAMHEVHIPLRDGMRSLYRRIESELDLLPPGKRNGRYLQEVERLFATLMANRFTAPPAEQSAAA